MCRVWICRRGIIFFGICLWCLVRRGRWRVRMSCGRGRLCWMVLVGVWMIRLSCWGCWLRVLRIVLMGWVGRLFGVMWIRWGRRLLVMFLG